MKRLPSLDSLRAFESAARHLSFTRAGDELHVTQSALSHRISALEDELGVKLFRRLTRKLELTAAGETLAAGVRRGLAEIARAVGAIDRKTGAEPLAVSALPSVATRWVVPRLPRFRNLYPDIDVRITADSTLVNLQAHEADLAVRFGPGVYPGLHVIRLMSDSVFPVCSPRLLAERGPITQPAQIADWPLLHDMPTELDGSGSGWSHWLNHVGAGEISCAEGLRFNQAILALEAAANGLGVALVRRSLIGDDLASGRLVRLLPHEAPTLFSYYIVCLPESVDRPAVSAFCKWLVAEAAAWSAEQAGMIHPPANSDRPKDKAASRERVVRLR
jgi:LysR family transcriptional regulator, glycine cleavage system transcriptional activator